MKVKITGALGSASWYAKHIGTMFNVEECGSDYFRSSTGLGYILKSDCEVIHQDVTTKVVSHEGISYIVPMWANYLIRNEGQKVVTYWELKPEIKNGKGGLWYPLERGGYRSGVAEVVVVSPSNSFVVAI